MAVCTEHGFSLWRTAGVLKGWLLARSGEADRGLAKAGLDRVEEGLALVTETSERWNAAELHLRQGELLLASSVTDRAEASFREALAIARDQSAKLWELRAATGLARLWCDRAARAEARDLLAPVHDWFAEGRDTADLKDARALLEELS